MVAKVWARVESPFKEVMPVEVPMQVLPMAKHPPLRVMPPPKVLVELPVTCKRFVAIPPVKDEVAEEVAVRKATVGAEVAVTPPAPLPVKSMANGNEVTPVPPFATPRVPVTFDARSNVPPIVDSVVVALQVGTPLTRARTNPSVPWVVVANAPAPLPSRSVFAVKEVCPVPPYGTPIVEAFQTPPVRVPIVERLLS